MTEAIKMLRSCRYGQRTPGLVNRLRELLSTVDLARVSTYDERRFRRFLDDETDRLVQGMPAGAQHWGIARKVLNIFLRTAAHNCFLRDRFCLDRIEAFLELPIDSLTAKGLKAFRSKHMSSCPPMRLPRWKGVKGLQSNEHESFQKCARQMAQHEGTLAVHLDIYLWLNR